MTTLTEMLLKEMDQEAETTRKMLASVPDDKYDWKPHEKSMTIRRLATHIADIPSWVEMAIDDDELDFATSTHKEPVINNTKALLKYYEECVAKGRTALVNVQEEQFDQPWTMRSGDQVYMVATKGEVIRMAYSQIVHHRAQLGVFLRLLDVPVPGSYGPSADEQGF
ncbi:MAG: DinB family protein [Mucilaginibacter sp.]|jgi:uncharacterized damage-inducible protein DinB|nr:DinB family protein [Mucilaginibacter sp.]